MLVRIGRQQVRIGMFVERLEGTWLDHPFWSGGFLLSTASDVDKLRASEIAGVVIDLSKGVGVSRASATDPAAAPFETSGSPRDEAVARLIERSGRLVAGMFGEARSDRPLDVERASDLVDEIIAAMRRNPVAMLQMTRLKTKDACTYQHSVAVCALMVQFARYLGMDEGTARTLGMGGLLHDIGKVTIPAKVLTKAARLSDGEMTLMRNHPTIGHAILTKQSAVPDAAVDICLNHHERIDGKGYPTGIPGADISRAVRMASICDVYDAVTSHRPYKEPWSSAQALAAMMTWTGQFDELLLLQFAASLGTRIVSTRQEEAPAVAAAVV